MKAGAGPGSGAFHLTLPDAPYDYRMVDTGLYEVRLNGEPLADVMFRLNAKYRSVAMQAFVAALNEAAK